MKEVKLEEVSQKLLGQLFKGAFLTVQDSDGKLNTMTISWGTIGCMWKKPVFMAMVRKSRYTYDIIEQGKEFTVSFPLKGNLKQALAICGTKSGRETNKFIECSLTSMKGEKTSTPVIKECNLHLECKIVYKHPVDAEMLAEEMRGVYGEEQDYHTLYYGEILSCYESDKSPFTLF